MSISEFVIFCAHAFILTIDYLLADFYVFCVYRLVEEALKPLDPSRRSYRLIGGVLVERTVGEVLPTLSTNRAKVCDIKNFNMICVTQLCSYSLVLAKLEEVVKNLETTLTEKQKETNEWKLKYNIRTTNNS